MHKHVDSALACKKKQAEIVKQIKGQLTSSPINVFAVITLFLFNSSAKIVWSL